MRCYVILRGPLGVGKSTISATLAKALGAAVVSIDQIVDPKWDGGSLRLFLAANREASLRARRKLTRGVPVVVDGCFYWKTQILDLERRLPYPHAVFTLKAPLAVCIERDAGRKVAFGPEAAERVFRKVARVDYGIPIDATRSIASTARAICARLPRPEDQVPVRSPRPPVGPRGSA